MIGELYSVWRSVLMGHSVQAFDDQKSSATRERTMTGIILAAIVAAVLSFLVLLLTGSGFMTALSALVRTLVTTILGFYLFCYVLQFVATRFFGGTGAVDEQAYLISTFWVPVSIITQVCALLGAVGGLVAFVVGLYSLLLITYAVQSGHRMSVGSAIISWILSGIVTAIVLGILSAVSFGWL